MKSIEYADKSWNPYTGCESWANGICEVGKNCWALNMAYRLKGRYGYAKVNPFRPTFHPDKLDIPLKRKKPTRFDTCFMGDITYAKRSWIYSILEIIRKCPQHRFYFLTKIPDKLWDFEIPDNAWVGVTVNYNNEKHRIGNLFPVRCKIKYVSFEPIYEKIECNLKGIDWVILGAQTGRKPLQPGLEWVLSIITTADKYNIPIFMKDNLYSKTGFEGRRREFPKS